MGKYNGYGYGGSYNYDDNYNLIKDRDDSVKVITAEEVAKTDYSKRKKSTGKYKEKLLLNMKGFKDRLREVSKKENKAYHTLATDIIIKEVKRLEKKHKREKFIEKQYEI